MAEYLVLPAFDRCANNMCVNRFGEGKWVLYTAPPVTVGSSTLGGLLISLCAPCATRLSRETEGVPTDG